MRKLIATIAAAVALSGVGLTTASVTASQKLLFDMSSYIEGRQDEFIPSPLDQV